MKNPAFPFRSGIWLILGLVASTVAIVGLPFSGSTVFLQAYLFSYMFWLGLTLGCLAIAMIAYLTNSSWGQVSRPILEAGAKTIWLMLILFVPIALGLMRLYVWAVPAEVQAQPLLAHKSPYLNIPFFLIRAAVYFAVWIFLTQRLSHMARQPETYSDPDRQAHFKTWSAIGIIIYFLTMTFASIDWIMSLTPDWYSTIFGLLVILAQALSAFSLVLLFLPRLAKQGPLNGVVSLTNYYDLGSLLLTCVMAWAYMAVSQLLIIWSGNIPEEVMWYFDRSSGGWLEVGIFVVVFQLALPFSLLIWARTKKNTRLLAGLGLLILATRLVDSFWLVAPAFSPRQFTLHWMDLVLPVAIGGLWLAAFAWFITHTPFFIPETKTAYLNGKEVKTKVIHAHEES
jgi:hypothetical protein